MARESETLAKWAGGGAVAAIIVSLLTLLMPLEFGGYNAWNDVHLVFHNLVAILTRIIVFAVIGAALAGVWHGNRRSKR